MGTKVLEKYATSIFSKSQLAEDATTYHSGTKNLSAQHGSCLISFADHVQA
jgi:hypothetical protein